MPPGKGKSVVECREVTAEAQLMPLCVLSVIFHVSRAQRQSDHLELCFGLKRALCAGAILLLLSNCCRARRTHIILSTSRQAPS